MSSNRTRRIAKEIADIQNDPLSKIIVEPYGNGEDLTHLRGQFEGPPDTAYEGGRFFVDIRLPSEYPFRPPVMKFETRMWHPNVSSQTGAICLDTLANAWSPVLTIKSALISLQSLLSTPEPKDPQDAEVAGMLIRNPKEFEHVAREWAIKYAGAPRKEIAEGSGGSNAESLKKKAQLNKEKEEKAKMAAYHGYNKELIDRFVAMGFDVPTVVSAFEYVGIDKMDGEDYELEEAYMGDITARLFGEA
ncbi:ubiquitin-conjugating enzyme E2-24 kDa [Viridothelium virens]|uniref:Ubiquitin-conjugating enzyme E2 1 n=1 Tax=Viridothelium virens TaxID=1048519 RepID=A0A6A6HKP2_VIRVR|nr:ubiquitin-conjugating enzyme E2-24 kDa [Viridothelium virens]